MESRRSNSRSKPTVDRNNGEKSKLRMFTASFRSEVVWLPQRAERLLSPEAQQGLPDRFYVGPEPVFSSPARALAQEMSQSQSPEQDHDGVDENLELRRFELETQDAAR